jgi:GNAT superfamily N-acetyltransferase
MATIQLKTVTGAALAQHCQDLARLRIQVFKEFPYLYAGSYEYEQVYLQAYLKCPQAAFVLALDGEKIVGASSCIPMQYADAIFQQPFIRHKTTLGLELEQLFYCAESVLEPAYRGKGIGLAFFQAREAYARRLGGLTHSCFCAVERPVDHALRPATYQPLEEFWHKCGYSPQVYLTTSLVWQDIDQTEPTAKTMNFWLKELN